MNQDVSLLISTCDKFSDLWDTHIDLLYKNWQGEHWKTYLVTDRETDRQYDGVEVIVAGDQLDFPMRIKYALSIIDTEYVLLTLDDYFLIEETESDKLNYLVKRAKEEKIDYLMLYNRRKANKKHYAPIEKLMPIDLNQKYAVTLYPAIWNKSFLDSTIKDDGTAWEYEPSLTKSAIEYRANCQFSHSGAFEILDVVRKGKVLHKANSYFTKNGINIGNRPLISRMTEIKLMLMDMVSWYMPKSLFKMVKKFLSMTGMTFYSQD